MITGRSSGTGQYSYHESSCGPASVMVAHMPEDEHVVRIVLRTHGETQIPVIKLGLLDAELLWASLNRMAKDLKWEDRLAHEPPAAPKQPKP